MKLKETNHSYYCSDSNYYVDGYSNFGRSDYDDWDGFKEDWLGIGDDNLAIDSDYNHCFRFDIKPKIDEETDEAIDGEFQLWLFFMLQRKGIFRPVWIKNIKNDDMEEVNIFLERQWGYIKSQWEEFSNK